MDRERDAKFPRVERWAGPFSCSLFCAAWTRSGSTAFRLIWGGGIADEFVILACRNGCCVGLADSTDAPVRAAFFHLLSTSLRVGWRNFFGRTNNAQTIFARFRFVDVRDGGSRSTPFAWRQPRPSWAE